MVYSFRILPLKSINDRIEADVLAALREDRSTKAIARKRGKAMTDSVTFETFTAVGTGYPGNDAITSGVPVAALKSNIATWRGEEGSHGHDSRAATL